MSQAPIEKQFDNLADRLRRLSLTQKDPQEDLNQILKMPLEELMEERVAFGKAHIGKAFKDLTSETKYLSGVCRELPSQPETGACQTAAIHPTPCGDLGRTSAPKDRAQGQGDVSTGNSSLSHRLGGRRGGDMGSSERRSVIRDAADARSHEQGGDDASRSSATPDTPECPAAECLNAASDTCLPVPPSVVADMCEAIHDVYSKFNSNMQGFGLEEYGDSILYTRENNWVAKEMWEHFAQQGIYPNSPVLTIHKADLLEIYCSSDSQLTKQAKSKGLWAERHGLAEGDLTTADGRCKLYDRLLQLLPKNVWLSPKCRAWCRWNEFNRHRSAELAQKVMRAREADQVHLLLCDAIFEFQMTRSQHSHAHLEQPAGSQMLFQEEMEAVLAQSFLGRCDMCTAGALKHPTSGMPLQKGTQIITSSQIMKHRVDALKCQHDHQHDHVAGSCMAPGRGRVMVSQYSELYTRMFAEKMVKCFLCSAAVAERNSAGTLFQEAFVTRPAEDPSEDASLPKRMRLDEKQTPSAAYLQSIAQGTTATEVFTNGH